MTGGPESLQKKESRIESIHEPTIPEKTWLFHSIIRHAVEDMHPCTAPHRMRNMDGNWVEQGQSLFNNQCAIRMADALRRAGIRIPKDIMNRYNIVTCGAHSADEMHVIRARELALALGAMSQSNRLPGFKKVEKIEGAAVKSFFERLPGRQGILYISGYYRKSGEEALNGEHIDFYDGTRTTAKPLSQTFDTIGLVPNYQHAREMWFFEIDDATKERMQKYRRADLGDGMLQEGGKKVLNTLTAAAGALSLSLRVALGRTIGGTFDDAVDADNRSSVISRRTALLMGLAAGLTAPFLNTSVNAQERKRQRPAQRQEPVESTLSKRLDQYELELKRAADVFKNGNERDLLQLLLKRPEVGAFERLPDHEKRALFARVHLGYLTPEEEAARGLMSFPIVPSKITPAALRDAKKELLRPNDLQGKPLASIFDGSTWYTNGVRVGASKRLLGGMYSFAVRGRSASIMQRMKQGQQCFSIDRTIEGPFAKAGIMRFDEEKSRSAHGTRCNVLWLKNPDVSENNGSAESKSLEWDAQQGLGVIFDMQGNQSLQKYVERAIRTQTEGKGEIHEEQKAIALAGLTSSRLMMLSSSDVHYYEATMQTASNAAITKIGDDGKPVLIGLAKWRIHLPKPDGTYQVALIVSGAEETKQAIAESV